MDNQYLIILPQRNRLILKNIFKLVFLINPIGTLYIPILSYILAKN